MRVAAAAAVAAANPCQATSYDRETVRAPGYIYTGHTGRVRLPKKEAEAALRRGGVHLQ